MRIVLLLLALAEILFAQADRFGLPACASADLEFANRTFLMLCNSSTLRAPIWVAYELTPDHLGGQAARPSHFRPDMLLARPGGRDADYRGSGYSRGHLAPAADFRFSEEAMRTTFFLSNAVPQDAHMNSGVWVRLENAVRKIAVGSDSVYIVTGAIYPSTPDTIGPDHVAVPSHLFKVVLALKGQSKSMYAAIVPNDASGADSVSRFVTTVDEVERRTGIDFFAALPDEEEHCLEAQANQF